MNNELINGLLEELQNVRKIIIDNSYKRILIQLPDGLKCYADLIFDNLSDICEVFFYGNSNFGGCDLPNIEGFDAVFNFYHTEYFSTAQLNDIQYDELKNK
ncbi:MAG: hypothetical protein QXS41_01865 [Candidatus Woesearchaeota archaeon]